MNESKTIIVNLHFNGCFNNNSGNINLGSIEGSQGAFMPGLLDYYKDEAERRGKEVDSLLQYVAKLENEVKLLRGGTKYEQS